MKTSYYNGSLFIKVYIVLIILFLYYSKRYSFSKEEYYIRRAQYTKINHFKVF